MKEIENRKEHLKNAKRNKADEFYTQLSDIERELIHYKEHFKDKIVLYNCDDPYESNFFKYFAMNFNHLRLKKLIATCYDSSPVAYTQLSFFGVNENKIYSNTNRHAYRIEINEVPDMNNDGAIDLSDVKLLLQNKKNTLVHLKGDGDFRSVECVEFLKQADIVVTNPPFSLFREYVAQLIKYGKEFLIIGNVNALSYCEIFPLIKSNRMWVGYKFNGSPMMFRIPDNYEVKGSVIKKDKDGNTLVGVGGTCWFTNLDIVKRHTDLIMYKCYNPNDYPKYDNYDAINIDKTSNIPCDYFGYMGVPITYLDKYNPDQFQLIGLAASAGYNKDIVGLEFKGDKDARPLINGKNTYARIFIKRRKK